MQILESSFLFILGNEENSKKFHEIHKSLLELKCLYNILYDALLAFESLEFTKFDPIVGENACQIRAAQIFSIPRFDSSILKSISLKMDVIDQFISKKTFERNQTFLSIAFDYDLEMVLDDNFLFLFSSYFLTLVKEESVFSFDFLTRRDRCVSKKAVSFYPYVSSSFFQKLAKVLRRALSQLSVSFIQKLAFDLTDIDVQSKVSQNYVRLHGDLSTIATFWGFKVILSFLKAQKIPICLYAKSPIAEKVVVFQYFEESFSFKKIDTFNSSGLFMIQGVSFDIEAFSKKMEEMNLEEFILAISADHRQYLEPSLLELEDEVILKYKKIAKENGFSIDNPTTFFAQHIKSISSKEFHNIFKLFSCLETAKV